MSGGEPGDRPSGREQQRHQRASGTGPRRGLDLRLLVTGAAGFLGRRFMGLAPEGVEIIAVARPDSTPPADGAEWIECDLAEPGFERALPGGLDAVVHLAQSRLDHELPEGADDVFRLTVDATARLLEHARRHDVSRFVLGSTATLYARSPRPLTEDSRLDCSSFYAASKRSAELLLDAHQGSLSCLALRIFTLYGPGQRDRLIPELVRRVRAGEPVQLEGDRGLMLSPIFVDDLALAIHGLLQGERGNPGFEVVNVAGEEALGIRELAERIGRAAGTEPVFETVSESEPGGLVADCAKLKGLLPGFRPIPFEAGIRELAAGSSG